MSADISASQSQQHYLSVIRKGEVLGKYGRQGKGMKARFLILSRDGQRLEFRGKGMHRIPFKSVMLVAPGRESANFKSKDRDLHKINPAKFRALSRISFSMHYYDADGFSRSLDIQCLGNQQSQRSPDDQYEAWFNGLSILVQVVRTYDHIPQALLSADAQHILTSDMSLTEQGSQNSNPPMARSSAPQGPVGTAVAGQLRGMLDQPDDAYSEVSYNTHTSTDMESFNGRPNAAGSSMSASDSGAGAWQSTGKAPLGRNSMNETSRSGSDSNAVFICGRNLLQTDSGKQSAAAPSLSRLDALTGIEVQQTLAQVLLAKIGRSMQTAMADRAIIAITTSGSVYAYGTTADGETFATVTRLQGLMNHKCRQITCGHSATFVLTSTGNLLAWGRCASGLLGTTSRASIFSPKLIKFVQPGVSPRELRMRSISAGMHHAAAVSDGMMLFTWGDGAYGRLGHGSMESCYEPRQVTALQHRRVSTVSCGHYHTAAICCDMASPGHEEFMQRTPDAMESYDDSIGGESLARASTLTLHHASGTLYTWGGVFGTQGNFLSSSNEGCLGLPSLEKHEGVDKPHAVELSDVVDVACGLNFTVAITTSGAVYQMGSMLRQGPVAAAPWESTAQPARVRGTLSDLHAVRVMCGRSHALVAARPAGQEAAGALPTVLVSWGSNEHGQLGRQAPAERAGNMSSRRVPGEPMVPSPAESAHWLTPAVVGDLRHSPISSMSAAADTSCVVVQMARGVLATMSRSTNSSSLRKPMSSVPHGSPGGRGRFNQAKALLQTVRPGGRAPERPEKPQRPQITNLAQPGVTMLNSTMPPSSWVNHKAAGPRAPHLVRSSSAEAIPDLMMGPKRKPAVLLPTIPPSVQSSAHLPTSQALPPEPSVDIGTVDTEDEKEVPPPALAYGSTAEMMRKLHRDGGRLKGLASLPASPATGSSSREKEKQAVEDRLAWLEQVINDRNMGFSITGSAPEDEDAAGATQDSSRAGKPPDANGEDLACLLAEFQPMEPHNRPRRPHSASAAAMISHVAMEPPVATGYNQPAAKNGNGFKVPVKSPLATPHRDATNAAQTRSPAMMLNPPPPPPVHKPYHMPRTPGPEALQMHDAMQRQEAQQHEGTLSPEADMDAASAAPQQANPLEQPDEVKQAQLVPDLPPAASALAPSISDPPADAVAHPSGPAVPLAASAAMSSLSPGFMFLNAQEPKTPDAQAGDAEVQRQEEPVAPAATASPQHDPFSNVWQHLQTPTSGAQLLSISNSEAGAGAGGGTQSKAAAAAAASAPSSQAAPAAMPSARASAPLIQDMTSETAALRMQIEKLRRQSQEEKEARKAIEARALDLRVRLAAARGESGEPGAAPSASGQPRENLTRFRSLVEHNPVIVDSFWVPVDDGVSARLDVAEYTVLGKLKFSSRLFDNRAVKEWYRQNKHKVEVGNLVASTLSGASQGASHTPPAPAEKIADGHDATGAALHAVYGAADGGNVATHPDGLQPGLLGPAGNIQSPAAWGGRVDAGHDPKQVSQAALQRFLDDSFAAGGPDRMA